MGNPIKKREGSMRKKAAVLLLGIMTAAALLAGCGSGSSDSSSSTGGSSSGNSAEGNGTVLVVWYSASGNTKAVGQKIADTLDADTFEVTPKKPYTDDDLDYTDDSSRVSKEHDDESLRDVELKTTKVDNWDAYDTVFIGYPIWWGEAAWPINNFVKDNDFSGKTVIPFCTSASSGIGSSAADLEKLTNTGDWKEGQRFEEHPDDADVESWAKSAVSQ